MARRDNRGATAVPRWPRTRPRSKLWTGMHRETTRPRCDGGSAVTADQPAVEVVDRHASRDDATAVRRRFRGDRGSDRGQSFGHEVVDRHASRDDATAVRRRFRGDRGPARGRSCGQACIARRRDRGATAVPRWPWTSPRSKLWTGMHREATRPRCDGDSAVTADQAAVEVVDRHASQSNPTAVRRRCRGDRGSDRRRSCGRACIAKRGNRGATAVPR